MKKFSFKIRGHKYDVEVLNQERNIVELEINGSHYSVELDQEIQVKKTPTLVRAAVQTHKPIKKKEAGTGSLQVKCPLPGNIMQIMVKVGDTIAVGDKLLMYEAMKMENVVLADKAGTISKIHVSIGDAVLQDDTLIDINLS
ncbi:MAG: acetyl-CoA carboxylase biotin carboxyl carrier protein subunit [Bacteroidales bacterium]|nr:acetyl-CoA carboxylase biotin carboxyl carrier protein subunit [Bacteroidales bacterium]